MDYRNCLTFINKLISFAYLPLIICTRVRVRGERVRARPGVVRCAVWPLQSLQSSTRHVTNATAGIYCGVGPGIGTTASPSLQRATWQHPAAGCWSSADLGRLIQGSPTPAHHLPRLSAQRGAIGPRTLSGFIRASFYRTIILLLNMNTATLQNTHRYTVQFFRINRLDKREKTHVPHILK